MCQIGTKSSFRGCACHNMAIHAGSGLEDSASLENCVIHARGLALIFYPALEIRARLHIYAQQHLGVLRPAILRTLAEKEPGLLRINPGKVCAVRYQISLAGEPRHPEAVIGVGRK